MASFSYYKKYKNGYIGGPYTGTSSTTGGVCKLNVNTNYQVWSKKGQYGWVNMNSAFSSKFPSATPESLYFTGNSDDGSLDYLTSYANVYQGMTITGNLPTIHVNNYSNVFKNCNLAGVTPTGNISMDYGYGTPMVFNYAEISNVSDGSYAFYNATLPVSNMEAGPGFVIPFCTPAPGSVVNASHMYDSAPGYMSHASIATINELNIMMPGASTYYPSYVTDVSYMYANTMVFISPTVTMQGSRKVTNMTGMYYNVTLLESMYFASTFVTSGITDLNNIRDTWTQTPGVLRTDMDAGYILTFYDMDDDVVIPEGFLNLIPTSNVQIQVVCGYDTVNDMFKEEFYLNLFNWTRGTPSGQCPYKSCPSNLGFAETNEGGSWGNYVIDSANGIETFSYAGTNYNISVNIIYNNEAIAAFESYIIG